jgi:SAM-dependent methyltransferase
MGDRECSAGRERPVTLLAEDARVWDAVFRLTPSRMRFVEKIAKRSGDHILDVGCATGSVCRLLRRHARPVGVDINPLFIAAARAKDSDGEYCVGDMRSFQLGRLFDLVICLGTTFSYNLTNRDVTRTLINFRKHLKPKGQLVIDVLNAIAFTGPRPFQVQTRHEFTQIGFEATATIRHRLDLEAQRMSEQVSWKVKGRRVRRDPEESLRLFFPQELAFHLEVAGFDDVKLMDSYGKIGRDFSGRRLIALAARARKSVFLKSSGSAFTAKSV